MAFLQSLTRLQKICWSLALLWVALNTIALIFMALTNAHPIAMLSTDTQLYMDAGQSLAQRSTLYDIGSGPWATTENYRYHPLIALAFSLLVPLSQNILKALWVIILLLVYVAGVYLWYRVAQKFRVTSSNLISWLPITLISLDLGGALVFGNVNPFMFMLSALLVLQLLDEHPVQAGVLMTVIVLVKIQWAFFPLVLLIIFKDWKLLVKTVGWTVIAYGAINILYILAVGPNYAASSLQEYVVFLLHASQRFPWQGLEVAFNTSNNSIYQTILRYAGFVPWATALTMFVQIGIGVALLAQILLARRDKISRKNKPEVALTLAFAAYLWASLLLLQTDDVLLGSIIFCILWVWSKGNKWVRYLMLFYLLYAFVEIPAVILSFATHGTVNIPLLFPTVLIATLTLLWGCLGLSQSMRELDLPLQVVNDKPVRLENDAILRGGTQRTGL